jgi:putative ABC transport system permease protein
MVVVFPGSSTQGGARGGMGSAPTLTIGDSESLEKLPTVRRSAPVVRSGAQIVWQGSNWSAPVIGTTPAYLEVRSWPIDRGAMFSDEDVRAAAKVCVIGKTVLGNLFGADVDPIDETIRVRGVPCRVVGVLSEKGSNGFGNDDDDVVIMPWSTLKRRLVGGDPQLVNVIVASAVAPDATTAAQGQITGLLRQRHRIGEGQPEDFQVRDLREVARTAGDAFDILTKLLGSIALVSLIVGGIGIMNIMLVSVTERTREIGIRVAVGARAGDILVQFLVEAVMLSVLGGGLGVALGVWGAGAVANAMDWPKLVSAGTLILGFVFAAIVGILFGLYPAIRASRLDPIDALRYE